MIQENLHIADLLYRHLSGLLGEEDDKELVAWLDAASEHRQLMERLGDEKWLEEQYLEYEAIDARASWETIRSLVPSLQPYDYDTWSSPDAKPIPVRSRLRITSFFRSVAAIWVMGGIALAGVIGYFLVRKSPADLSLGPAGDRAFLHWAGMSDIALQDLPSDWSVQWGTMDITHPEAGMILCSEQGRPAAAAVLFDSLLTLSTPKGGKYRLQMPDGSSVRLNAASYVQFAASFGRQGREVDLQGEGFFEVKPVTLPQQQDKEPFIVHVRPPKDIQRAYPDSSLLTITASGTRFNVKAYPSDSSIRTTLLSGMIRIQKTGDSMIRELKPGQTYVLNKDGSAEVHSIDTANAVPWKDGKFTFKNQPINDIFQELARWYNADFVCKETPQGVFNLYGFRDEPIAELLQRLEDTGRFRFKIQAHSNKIIVSIIH